MGSDLGYLAPILGNPGRNLALHSGEEEGVRAPELTQMHLVRGLTSIADNQPDKHHKSITSPTLSITLVAKDVFSCEIQ